jgi:hypothetical protein
MHDIIIIVTWTISIGLLILYATRERWLGGGWESCLGTVVIGVVLVLVGGVSFLMDLSSFISKHSTFFFWAFSFFLVISFVGLTIFLARRMTWPWWVRGVCIGTIAAFFVLKVFLPLQRYEQTRWKDEQLRAEQRAYEQKAYTYFHEQCAKDSGRFVYKPVETPQESVYIMKPRRRASPEDVKNQFWMGDPYMGGDYYKFSEPKESDPPIELIAYIGSGNRYSDEKDTIPPYLSFVEMLDLDNPNQLWRYTYEPTGHMKEVLGNQYPEKKLTRVPIDAIQSRYGFTWEDLSTPEGRQYWVAKSRLQIIDLQTHEVIAERIGYLIEGRSFGMWNKTFGGDYGWKGKKFFCPSRPYSGDEAWIRSVLLNVPFE